MRDLETLDREARETRIYHEIISGNVPDWMRDLEPVEITGVIGGRERRVTMWVTPDYLAVGSSDDYFLVPLTSATAQRIAAHLGASLPTPRMVDAIWESAEVHLMPIRFRPDEHMTTFAYFVRHDAVVKGQRMISNAPPGTFVAGHKLDVVAPEPGSADVPAISIYGWHFPDGRVLQPLFTAMSDEMVAFSHGVRLVHRNVLVDGVWRDIAEILSDSALALLFTHAQPRAKPRVIPTKR